MLYMTSSSRHMSEICPSCRSEIAIEDINVSTDIALCRSCDRTFSFSEIVGGRSPAGGAELNSPPRGAWFEQLPNGFRVGAATRSWMALFLVPFTCVWAGMSLSGIYGRQILSRNFNAFDSLFGPPFLIGSCLLIGMCAMTVAGKVEISKTDDQLKVFTGIGPIGWSRNFIWPGFTSVREDNGRGVFNFNRQASVVVLEGKGRVTFETMWSEERHYFVLSALRTMLKGTSRVQSNTASSFRRS